MGKPRIIAETGAGQHGVATATACALLGLECVVYMGTKDIERQAPNVLRMDLLGRRGAPGRRPATGRCSDAINEAMRDWVANVAVDATTSSARRPGRTRTRDGARVPGGDRPRGARADARARSGALPDAVVACVGGGSNAIGHLAPLPRHAPRGWSAWRPAGGATRLGDNAASLGLGAPGVLHGAFTMLPRTTDGQVVEPHSISAGLDYPGVGPAAGRAGRVGPARGTSAPPTPRRSSHALAGARRAGSSRRSSRRMRSPRCWHAARAARRTRMCSSTFGPRRQGPRHPGARAGRCG